MTRSRSRALVAALAVTLAGQAGIRADREPVAPATAMAAAPGTERFQYVIGARVRPLLVFWITRDDVGDAVVTRRRAADEADYSLLIGTDPQRTPMHVNRWGYIEEEIRGARARLLGVMTESDEESIEQAEAGVRTQAVGSHPFKIIHATTDGEQAHARVASIHASQDYTLRQVPIVLDLAGRDPNQGRERVAQMPPGTRPGFLAALVDAMHASAPRSITYVYYGRLYELRRLRSKAIPDLRIAQRSFGPAVAADFVVTSAYDGEQTKFSMTYGTQGRFAEVPLTVTYQPRWWMQLELTIAAAPEPAAIESKARQ
ncbi:MAG TPA: hypothetical protein VKD69_14565 [Vicinamibacterales bacterium]|nr:hypothetical protein [Vicinamibacterales bacterium]